MYKAVHLKKKTNKTIPQEQPVFNWFIQYVGFYKVGKVVFLFNYFPGERQKVVWFPKLTTIQKVK